MRVLKQFRLKFTLLLLIILGTTGCSADLEKKEDPKALNKLGLGASANQLLSDHAYTSMIIEVAFVPGHEPSAVALNELKGFLQTYTHKPEGISFVKTALDLPKQETYSVKQIREIEDKYRTYYNEEDRLAIFIFFADGKSDAEEENKVILGTAYRNTSIAIFEESIHKMSEESVFITKNEIISTTLKHEFGHLFGLVNNGSPAQSEHVDSESKSHCNVSDCIMVSTVAFGKGAVNYIKSRQKSKSGHVLDPKCHQDLVANGGK